MANQGDIRAGRAFVEVFTDDSKLQQGLLAINKRMDAWSQKLNSMGIKAMAAAGAMSVPFAAGIKLFSDFGDQIEKMAYRTGMSTEFLSELAHAAGLSGTDIKVAETAIRGMQRTLSGAADELGSAEKKLEKLGLTLSDFKGKNPEQQFLLLIERLAEVKDETIRGAIALEIFGRGGPQLIPMAMAGTEEMRAMKMALIMGSGTLRMDTGDQFTPFGIRRRRIGLCLPCKIVRTIPYVRFLAGYCC